MPGPVDEVRTVAGVVDHRTRRGVDRLRGHAGTRGDIPGLLRAAYDVVHPLLLAIDRLADVHSPGDVGAIALASAAATVRKNAAHIWSATGTAPTPVTNRATSA